MDKINVVHAFSGVDSQLMAEKRVWGDRVNLLATMEVDVDAIISCAAIHENEKFVKFLEKDFTPEQYEQAKEYLKNRNIGFDFEKGKSKIDRMKKEKLRQLFIASKLTKNLGDISLANKVKMSEEVDIFTYSFPCTDISLAGKQDGLSKGSGTRSGLLWECEKFIEVNRPKVLLMENVKNLVQKKFINEFNEWCSVLEELGYKNYWKVLNAKNHGIPQNRERVFMISIRKDVDCGYEFPEGFPLQTRLKDVLEEDIDPKYYLSDEIVARFKAKMPSINSDIKIVESTAPDFRSIGQRDECYSTDGIIGCLAATDYKQPKQIAIPELDCLGMLDIKGNECINSDGLSPTLTTMAGGNRQPKILEEPKIIQVGNYMEDHPSFKNRNAGRVYDVKGLSPTLISHQTGGSNSVKILEEPKIIQVNIPQPVKVRVHDINTTELCEFLRGYKSKSNQEIADALKVRKTKVDHWFRLDSSFAIPEAELWEDLKKILNIHDSRYDKAITEFEIRDGVYEKSERTYMVDGLAPTLTCASANEKILEPIVCEQRSDEGLRYFKDNICGTLRTIDSCGDKRILEPLLIKEATKKGYAEAYDGDSVNLEQPNSQTRRGRVGTQIANTLMTSCAQGVVEGYRIRKLTPKECWNLMDFDADAFGKASPYISDSSLYKQAGNSIVVACMEHIFNNLNIDKIKGGNIWNIESQLTSAKTKENIG